MTPVGGRAGRSQGAAAEVHALAVDPRGRLLVGTRHGVVVSGERDAHRQRFTPLGDGGRQDDPVTGLSVDAGGGIWRTDRVHGFRGRLGQRRRGSPRPRSRGAAPPPRSRAATSGSAPAARGCGGCRSAAMTACWSSSRRPRPDCSATVWCRSSRTATATSGRAPSTRAQPLVAPRRPADPEPRPGRRRGGVAAGHLGDHHRFAAPLRPRRRRSATDIAHRGEVAALHADERGRMWMASGDRLAWFDEQGRHDETPLARGLAERVRRLRRIGEAACGSTIPGWACIVGRPPDSRRCRCRRV